MSLNGLFSLAPGEFFTPLRSKEAAALKCASCAAPLGPHEARCSYCLSWNPAYGHLGGIDAIEVTTLEDPVPRYWVGAESPVTGGYVAREEIKGHDGIVDARWPSGTETNRDLPGVRAALEAWEAKYSLARQVSWFQRLLDALFWR